MDLIQEPEQKMLVQDIQIPFFQLTFKIEPIKQTKVIKGKKREVIRRFEEDELTRGDDYLKRLYINFGTLWLKREQNTDAR